MPMPKKRPNEDSSDFMSRCMSDSKMREEYGYEQRLAVCMQQSKSEYDSEYTDDDNIMSQYMFNTKKEAGEVSLRLGLTSIHYHEKDDGRVVWMPGKNMEELRDAIRFYNEVKCPDCEEEDEEPEIVSFKDMIIPNESDYVSFDDEDEQDFEMTDPDEKVEMFKSQLKKLINQAFQLHNTVKEGSSIPPWVQDNISKAESHLQSAYDYIMYTEKTEAAEYKGKKVTLNKPFRTPKGPKKFAVYTKNEKGNVVIVRFGDPNMEIKRDDPDRRKSFRARHNCDNPGPKYKARYWSCKMWESKKSVTDYTG